MSGMLLVGCPVAHREWIIGLWADHVVKACTAADLEPWFVVVAGPGDPTPAALRDAVEVRYAVSTVATDVERVDDRRDWIERRYMQMAEIRNVLLGAVREMRPELFLSVDSDILLHPESIGEMRRLLEDGYGAAGHAVFLSRPPKYRADGKVGTPSWKNPNYAKLTTPTGGMMRPWRPDVDLRADVLMAVKLMTPAAYHVDYSYNHEGEDLGWSLGCRDAGLRLGWTSKVVSKHVMDSRCPSHVRHDPSCVNCLDPLTRVDPRCGY